MAREASRDIYRRRGRWWGAFPGDDRRSLKLPRDASRAQARERYEIWLKTHRAADAGTTTVGQAFDDFVLELKRRDRSLATIQIATRKAGHFVRLWGRDFPLDDVSGRLVAQYIRVREGEPGRHEKKVRPLTIRRELDVLRGALKLAEHHGRFHRSIATVMPLEYAPRYEPRRRWLSELEAKKLLAVLSVKRRVWVALAIGAGARRSEVTRIRREHVDTKKRIVHVPGTKTTVARADVPITSWQAPWIAIAMKHGRAKGPLASKWPMVSRDLKAACMRAGIAECTPNDLRRTLGYWLRHAGVSPHLIGRVLRHKDSTMAELVYATGDLANLQALLVRQIVRHPGEVGDTGDTGESKRRRK